LEFCDVGGAEKSVYEMDAKTAQLTSIGYMDNTRVNSTARSIKLTDNDNV